MDTNQDASIDEIFAKHGYTASTKATSNDWYSQIKQNSAPVAEPQTDYSAPFKEAYAGHPIKALGSALAIGAKGLMEAPKDIKNAFESGKKKVKNASHIDDGVERGIKMESGVASMISSPLAPLFKPLQQPVKAISDKLSDTKPFQEFGEGIADLKPSEQTPIERTLEGAADIGNITGTIVGVDQVVKAAPGVAKSIEKGYSDMTTKTKDSLSSSPDEIASYYTKAIKPSNAGKNDIKAMDRYNAQATKAIQTIVENKGALKFQNDTGEFDTGRLPTNRIEHAQAIDQAKAAVFEKYDALAKDAGEKGAEINLGKVGDALDEVITNESLKISHPEAVKYAEGIQARLKAQNIDEGGRFAGYKTIDPKTTQEVIKNYNESLQAFYRNPTYESATRAAIDAGVVTKLREALDEAVQNITGEDYQGLKDQYASLKAIEKDSAKAAMQQAKQVGTNAAGLGKYVDIFSGGDMVHGILSLNPALFAKGAAQTGIKSFFQWLKNPDRAITNMYKVAEGKTLGDALAGTFDENPSMGLSMKNVAPDAGAFAKKVGGADVPLIQNYVEDSSMQNFMKLQPILEANPELQSLTFEGLQNFFKEVFIERNNPNFKPAKINQTTPIRNADNTRLAGSKPVIPKELEPLAAEARNAKSMAEFVSSKIFGKGILPAERKALGITDIEKTSDYLTDFYNKVKGKK